MPTEKTEQSTSVELRVLPAEDVELRVDDSDGAARIVGYAAKYNRDSVDLGGFTEQIKPGAFDNALKSSDVRALKNHDANLLLGRTPKTLRLSSNSVGLRFEVDVPDTTVGRDTVEEIRRGDLTGCSFAFTVTEDTWRENEDGTYNRDINEVKELFDVGPVTYPAYPDTTVAARSLDKLKQEKRTADGETASGDETETKKPSPISIEEQSRLMWRLNTLKKKLPGPKG